MNDHDLTVVGTDTVNSISCLMRKARIVNYDYFLGCTVNQCLK